MMGIETVSFLLAFLSFVAELLRLFCSTSFSADPLIGVAVMGCVTVGQVKDIDCPTGSLEASKRCCGW